MDVSYSEICIEFFSNLAIVKTTSLIELVLNIQHIKRY